jgi:hypothetical protein
VKVEFIDSGNFESEATQSYINPISDPAEFWEDLERIKYIKRLLNRFRQSGELKTTLIINHLIIMFNVFESEALVRMLFFKLEGYHEMLKPFLTFIRRSPSHISPYRKNQPVLYLTDIFDDLDIVEELRKISHNVK